MKIKIFWTIPALIIIHTLIWFFAFDILLKQDTFGLYTNFSSFILQNQGEFYATLLMLMLSFNILLSTRLKIFESIFSGLDKVYVVHKYTGYFTVLLLILHNSFIAESRIHLVGFFSFAKDIASPLLYAFLLSIFISALPHIPYVNKILNIPYHIWKYTHYLMGFLFIIGIYHSVGVNTLTFSNNVLSIYMYIVYILGTLAFIYKTFLYKFLNKKIYLVSNIRRYEETKTIEINLTPDLKEKILNWKAGQFAFFKFNQDGLEETHPFTISNINNKGEIRLSIKALGDWTQNLFLNLKEDTKVFVDGPYGKFISEKENNKTEIWIAGGIGITPFLSMLEDYKKENNNDKKIIFVWSVKDEKEAIYKEEIEKDLPSNIEFTLHNTSVSGFFKFESLLNKITDKDKTLLYICGPAGMREAIIKDAKKSGITDFHYEEFNFR